MIVLRSLFVVFYPHSIVTFIHLPSQRKAKLFFTFTLFYVIFFSESVSEIFLCIFIHCYWKKAGKWKWIRVFLHRVFNLFIFDSFFFSFRELPKKVLFECDECVRSRAGAWRVQLLNVGTWVSLLWLAAVFWITHMLILNLMEINTIKS